MKAIGSHPDRKPGQEWKDTLSILAGIPATVAQAVVDALSSLQK